MRPKDVYLPAIETETSCDGLCRGLHKSGPPDRHPVSAGSGQRARTGKRGRKNSSSGQFRGWLLLFAAIVLVVSGGPVWARPNGKMDKPGRAVEKAKEKLKKQAAVEKYEQASSLFEGKHYQAAIDKYEGAIAYNPEHRCALNGLAWLLLTCDDYRFRDVARARKLARRAVAGEGVFCGPCWDTLGLAQLLSNDVRRAHVSFLKAMTLIGSCDNTALENYLGCLNGNCGENDWGSELYRIYYNRTAERLDSILVRSDGFFMQKKYLKALDGYTVFLLIQPEGALANRVRINRAKIWYDLHADYLSWQDASVVLHDDKMNWRAIMMASNVLLKNGDKTRAIEMVGQLVAMEPANDLYRYCRALVYQAAGQYELALTDLNAAILMNDRQANYYEIRAAIYLQSKQIEQAIADLQSAVRIDPDHERAAELLERLGGRNAKLAPETSQP